MYLILLRQDKLIAQTSDTEQKIARIDRINAQSKIYAA